MLAIACVLRILAAVTGRDDFLLACALRGCSDASCVSRSVGKAASDLADTLHIYTPTPRTDAAGAVVDESEDE